MAETLVFLVSKEPDFAEPLAEQLRRALPVTCRIVPTVGDVKDASLVIMQGNAPEGVNCPVLAVKDRPVRLRGLLDEAETLLRKAHADTVRLGPGHTLQLRQKQVAHVSGKAADVTDKEMRLLQALAAAGEAGLAKEELLRQVWGFGEALDTHTLETHIYRLRGKFRELADDDVIIAIDGGYRLAV